METHKKDIVSYLDVSLRIEIDTCSSRISQHAFRSSIFVLSPRTISELTGAEDLGLFGYFGRTFERTRGRGSFHSTNTGLACGDG